MNTGTPLTLNIEAIISFYMDLTIFQYHFSVIVQCLNAVVSTLAFALVSAIITINEVTNHFVICELRITNLKRVRSGLRVSIITVYQHMCFKFVEHG